MNTPARLIPGLLLLVLTFAGCSGGGSNGTSLAPAATVQQVSGTLTIGTSALAGTSSTARKPAYVGTGTTAVAIYIDAQTTPAGSVTSCTAATGGVTTGCSIPWSAYVAVPAAHTFHVVAGNGTTITAAGSGSYALVDGNNNALSPTLSLNGVVAQAEFFWNTCSPGTATITAGTCTGYVDLLDGNGSYIENTGVTPAQSISPTNGSVYDNAAAGLTFTSSASGTGIVTGSNDGAYAAFNTGTLTVDGPANVAATTGIPVTVACASANAGSAVYPGTPFTVTIAGFATSGLGEGALLAGQTDGMTYPTSVTTQAGYGSTFYCSTGVLSSSIGTLPVN